MSWLTDIFSSSASVMVDSVGAAVYKLITSDEEKLQLKNELVKIQLEATLKANELFVTKLVMMAQKQKMYIIAMNLNLIALFCLGAFIMEIYDTEEI